jgi:uncharacterized protein
MLPYLSSISIFPIKSLDGVRLDHVSVLASGALKFDREYAMLDERGQFVNGKRNRNVHQLRSTFDLDRRLVSLQIQNTDTWNTFHLDQERLELESWLSHFFGFTVTLGQNTITGFPDDLKATGPTVISTNTIAAIAAWFPEISVEDMRTRLRTNLEIAGVPAFWEDQLFGQADQSVKFQIGTVQLEGINPCQRCVVPTRDPKTGEATTDFQRIFAVRRQESLPSWTVASRFNHFYRLAVNTNLRQSEVDKSLQVNDQVEIAAIAGQL